MKNYSWKQNLNYFDQCRYPDIYYRTHISLSTPIFTSSCLKFWFNWGHFWLYLSKSKFHTDPDLNKYLSLSQNMYQIQFIIQWSVQCCGSGSDESLIKLPPVSGSGSGILNYGSGYLLFMKNFKKFRKRLSIVLLNSMRIGTGTIIWQHIFSKAHENVQVKRLKYNTVPKTLQKYVIQYIMSSNMEGNIARAVSYHCRCRQKRFHYSAGTFLPL